MTPRQELFVPKLQYFLSFKYNPDKTDNKFITLQFLSSDTDGFEKKATNYRTRFWSLVMVRNQLPAQRGQIFLLRNNIEVNRS